MTPRSRSGPSVDALHGRSLAGAQALRQRTRRDRTLAHLRPALRGIRLQPRELTPAATRKALLRKLPLNEEAIGVSGNPHRRQPARRGVSTTIFEHQRSPRYDRVDPTLGGSAAGVIAQETNLRPRRPLRQQDRASLPARRPHRKGRIPGPRVGDGLGSASVSGRYFELYRDPGLDATRSTKRPLDLRRLRRLIAQIIDAAPGSSGGRGHPSL